MSASHHPNDALDELLEAFDFLDSISRRTPQPIRLWIAGLQTPDRGTSRAVPSEATNGICSHLCDYDVTDYDERTDTFADRRPQCERVATCYVCRWSNWDNVSLWLCGPHVRALRRLHPKDTIKVRRVR